MSIKNCLFSKPAVYPWLKAIAAVADGNNVIGNKGQLPWNYPSEFKYYLKTTKGHSIIFGRATFESDSIRKDCKTYVLSSKMEQRDDVQVLRSVDEIQEPPEGTILWVCGGENIYKNFLPFCSELYITHIHGQFEGDTFFPKFEQLFKEKETIFECNEYTCKIYQHI